MSKQPSAADEYEDHRTHVTEQRYGILAGWAVVFGLALTVVLGISGPESTVQERVELAPVGVAFSQGEEGTLAAHIGMVPKLRE
jgi:hypothetical protein